MKRGFCLVELCLVLAIVSILCLIAVPNFMESQTRSNHSRVKSDLRLLATAIHAYQADFAVPPPVAMSGAYGSIFAPMDDGGTGVMTYAITTPVAYLTTHLIWDPFVAGDAMVPLDERVYAYHPYWWKWRPPFGTAVHDSSATPAQGEYNGYEFKAYYGAYRLLSVGPDRDYTSRIPRSWIQPMRAGVPYDATNGAVSLGNIIRSEKEIEQHSFKFFP